MTIGQHQRIKYGRTSMVKLEYIWVDGTTPTATLRSKTKVMKTFIEDVSTCPIWGFDGSSTNQAPGDNSDCVLKPVRLYQNPIDENDIPSFLVLCEVWDVDDKPHDTNNRFRLDEINSEHNEDETWVGFEQEYTLFVGDNPLGWPIDGTEPDKQGDYYCGRNIGEDIAREHMDACIKSDIGITGINSEVMLGQWEYQIFGDDVLKAADDLWVARWLLEKITDKYNVKVSLHPKPKKGDWNGAGCHANFSTKAMRAELGLSNIHIAIDKLKYNHNEHILVYGYGNDKRLTGKHETCSINEFRSGISDRGASIRIPWQVVKDKQGYLEDRRPAANIDPYVVAWRLIKTICE